MNVLTSHQTQGTEVVLSPHGALSLHDSTMNLYCPLSLSPSLTITLPPLHNLGMYASRITFSFTTKESEKIAVIPNACAPNIVQSLACERGEKIAGFQNETINSNEIGIVWTDKSLYRISIIVCFLLLLLSLSFFLSFPFPFII